MPLGAASRGREETPADFDKVLLDPPRVGAGQALRTEPLQRLVYVTCNPAILVPDSGYPVHERGLTLGPAGVLDMFAHTAHVESIAVFEPAGA